MARWTHRELLGGLYIEAENAEREASDRLLVMLNSCAGEGAREVALARQVYEFKRDTRIMLGRIIADL